METTSSSWILSRHLKFKSELLYMHLCLRFLFRLSAYPILATTSRAEKIRIRFYGCFRLTILGLRKGQFTWGSFKSWGRRRPLLNLVSVRVGWGVEVSPFLGRRSWWWSVTEGEGTNQSEGDGKRHESYIFQGKAKLPMSLSTQCSYKLLFPLPPGWTRHGWTEYSDVRG